MLLKYRVSYIHFNAKPIVLKKKINKFRGLNRTKADAEFYLDKCICMVMCVLMYVDESERRGRMEVTLQYLMDIWHLPFLPPPLSPPHHSIQVPQRY